MNAKFRWHYISVWSIVTVSTPFVCSYIFSNTPLYLYKDVRWLQNDYMENSGSAKINLQFDFSTSV